jgi:hypothetical protein
MFVFLVQDNLKDNSEHYEGNHLRKGEFTDSRERITD